MFCLFCNFFCVCSGVVNSGRSHLNLFVLKLCRYCFVCFVFFLCTILVCSGGSGHLVLFVLKYCRFVCFVIFMFFLCAVVVCSGGSGHLVIGSMALPATHRIKHPSPDLKTRKIWFLFSSLAFLFFVLPAAPVVIAGYFSLSHHHCHH